MPTIARSEARTVVGIWGPPAYVRGADGNLRLLKVGDVIHRGDHILTTQGGIVELSDGAASTGVAAAPGGEVNDVIEALNRDDPTAATAAGASAGDGGNLSPGLRVDRISEGVSPETLRTTGIARSSEVFVERTGAPEDQSLFPALTAISSTISAREEGSPVNLGLRGPGGSTASAAITVDQIPLIGQIVKADGTVVTVGSALTPSDLAGLVYVPPADYNGAAPVGDFTYTVVSSGLTSTGGTTISLTPINDAPVGVPSSVGGVEDNSLPISLTGEDRDGSVVSLTVTGIPAGAGLFLADGITQVLPGQTLTPAQAATLLFVPAGDFNGTTAITFTVTDNEGAVSAPAQVAITLTPVNDAPVAVPDSISTPEDTPVSGNLLANDTDIDGPSLAVTQFLVGGTTYTAGSTASLPGVGTLLINANGSFTFTPVGDYHGPVPLVTYTISDGSLTASSTLTLDIIAVNDPPNAVDDLAATPINTPVTVAVLANDSDVDGDPLTVSNPALADPAQGTVTLNPKGTLTFVPATNVTGPVTITYTIGDSNGGSDTATVTVNVGSNTPPDSADRTLTTAEDTPYILQASDFAFSDTDAGQSLNAVRIDTPPASGTLLLNGVPVVAGTVVPLANITAGELSFAPAANAGATPYANFRFSVQDSGGAFDATPNTITLNVTPVNDPPLAVSDNASTDEDTPVTLSIASLLANDSDADGDPLSLVSVQSPVNGTVALVGGNVVFTPAPDYNGPASFTYTVSDGQGGSHTATVNIDVRPVVDPTISISDVIANEGAGTASFIVTLSQATTAAVAVNFATNNGTATAGADYTATVGTLNFAPGVTSQTVTVPILNDAIFEGSETFSVDLSAPVNATIADGQGVGTIVDDGTGTGGIDNDTPILSVSAGNAVEGALAVFTVTLSNASTSPVVFTPSLASGTATVGTDTATLAGLELSANGGATWSAVTGDVTIPPGSTSVLLRLLTVDDALSEGSETFTLNAAPVSGATPAPASAVATIIDNDGPPALFIDDVTVNEAAGTATFTVTLSSASGLPVTVAFNTADSSATAGADYGASTGTLSFAPGVTSQTITVPIVNDAVFEGSETFSVNLSAATNATIADASGLGTIRDDGTGGGGTDDDTPRVAAVSSPTVTEGANLDFTVTLSNASTTPTMVTLTPASGSATLGTDTGAALVSFDGGTTFAPLVGATVSVPAGATGFIVRVPTVDDAISEPSETLTLAAATPANTLPVVGTGTINDNDGTPTLSISGPVTVNEGAGTATFTVTLSNASSAAVTVNYGTANGSAIAGSDYTTATGTLNFAPGVTSQTVTVTILDDTLFEGPETFSVNLSAPSNATIAVGTATTTIADDGTGTGGNDNDSPQVPAVSSPSVTEGVNLDFTVTLSNTSTTPTTVTLTPASGSATLGTDTGAAQVSFDGGVTFAPVVGNSVSVPAGTTNFIVRVPTIDDALGEPTEAMTLAASTPANAAPVVGTGTINDNDFPVVSISGPVTYNEAAGTASYTVSLSNPATTPVSVNYATADGTAISGADFTAGAGTLNFAPGVTSQTITVPIVNDAVFEGSETFSVNLSAPVGATLGTATSTTTLIDDGTGTGGTDNDTPRVATVSSPTVTEGANLDFTVTLSNASTTPTMVTLTPASGSATLGTDTGAALVSFDGGTTFAPLVGATVSVPAGATGFIVRVPTVDDAISEPSETLTLAAATPANTLPVVGTGTINDNDGTPTLSISGPAIVDEAAGTVTYTVALSNPSSSTVSVAYGTSDGSATAGADYTATSGTLSFAPGVLTQSITVPITNDTVFEGSETFSVNLSAPVGATLSTATVTSQIVDDGRTLPGGGTANDDTPSLSVIAAPIVEGGQAVFTVSLSNLSAGPVVFTPGLASGTATVGVDTAAPATLEFFDGATWLPVAGNVTIPAGSGSVQLRIATVDDAVSEPNETFSLIATPVSGSTPAPASAISTIVDNDGAPQFSINDVTINEAAGTITFTVSLSNPAAVATTIDYVATSGTASVPGDVAAGANALSGTLAFAAGVTSQTITLSVIDDAVFEGSETFTVNLSGAPAGTLIADAIGVGTIRDDGTGPGGNDDDRPRVVAVSSPTVNEGADLDFTVTLSNASTTPTTVTLASASGTATLGVDTGAPLVSFDGGASFATVTGATVSVPAGVTTFIVRVPTVDDTIDEPNEDMTLAASTPTNAAPVVGTGTIVDDDAAPTITAVSSPTVAEGTDLVYAVTLSNASATPSSFAFTLGGGTAAPADYGSPSFSNGVTLVGGNLIVPAGVSAFSVTLPTVDDALDEANETVPLTIGTASGTGTITDNDPTPSLAINDVSVNEAAGTASFTVTLSAASGQTVTVDYNTSDASASAGTDYTSTTGTLSFAPGVTSRTITVPITNDTLFEGNESFNVNLLNPSNATLADALGTGTIVDDDAAPTITAVSSPTVAEGTDLVYAVTLSNASATPSSFAFTLGGGTAAPADYGSPSFSNGVTLVGGNLIVPAGVSAFSVTLPTVDDALDEANETVPLTIGTASGTGTITDNDPTPSLAINDVSVNEAAGTASFTVTLSAASGQTVTVDYNTSDASASAGTDYTSTTGTLSFAPGVTSRTITVPITNDTLFEGNESFNVNLLNPSNATLADALGTGTIVDDDAAPTITAVSSPTVAEGTDLVYAVTLSNASATPSSFAFTLGGGTAAPADYGSPSFSNGVTLVGGNLIVPAGVSAFSVTLPTVDDALDEANETVPLTIGTASGTGTITDNDPTPSLAINDVSVNEAAGTASFTVTLSAASGQTVTVDYNTSDASASAGTDYTSTTGTLSFAPGVTSRTITVPITNDTLFEGNESFNVNLLNPSNATLADALGTGTIVDDDAAPTITAVSSPTVAEGTDLVYAVTLSNASATPSSFAFTLGGGTAAPADYGSPSFSNGVTLVGGNLIVPAGVSAFSVTLPTVDDALDEANETVPLTIGTASGTGTITDNDPTPSLAINDVSVNEAAGTASFTVTLSAASGQTVTVDYNTSDASASAGTDYTSTTGTLSFAPGVTSRTITVPITNDTLFEGNESFNVNLLNPSNATLADALGTGTIVDDDAAPTITAVSSPTVAEGTDLVYAVTLSNASATPSSFAFTLGGGTAAPADYGSPSFSNGVTLVGGNLIVPAGVSAFSVTLPTVDDALDEANETVPLTIGTASGTGTITDNDPTPSLAINDVSVNEAAGTASFTVTLSAASGQTVTVDYNTSDASASAGTDYTSTTGTLSFAPGVTSRTITVPITNDTLFEGNESFNVNLLNPSNATLADALGTGTIVDDDAAPTITAVSSPTVAEGTDLVYAVTLSNASATPSSFAFTLGGGTAAPADYGSPSFSNGVTLVGGNLIVPAGVSAFSVTLPTVDDALDEANETVPLTIGTASGTGTITDNDPTPSLAINDVSVNEAAGTASFTVTLSAASGQTVTVDYNTSDASASAGTDYTSTTGTLSFAPGVTSRTITVPITNDTLFEGNESFNVNLLNPSNATLADALGTGTIVDDDAAPTITAVSSPTVAEGTDLVYAVTLSNASATPSSFAFTLGGGTAAPADYGSPSFSNGVTLVGGNLIVPAGVSAFSVTLPTVDDALDEANETVPLTIGTASGTGTITDNDPTPSLAINDVSVNEAAGTASFTVTLSAASGQTVTVDYNTSDASASAGTDYTSTTGTLSFAPGVTSRTITVPITNDTLFEGNESFNVNLLNPSNATLADALGTGTIVDDDAAPTITAVSSPTVAEGTDLVYAVTLSNASATPSSFAFTLGGGTAAPADYGSPSFSNGVTLVGGNLIVPAGVSAFSVTLPTVDDALDEANETVPLTIGTASGTGTITDNDPTPSLAINDVSVNEAAGTASFTVTLSAASGQTVTVDYNTSDASASAGTDYTSTTGTLSFAPGVTSRTITVPITNDTLFEGNESFNVNLLNPSNATLADALGTGTIVDDDAAPTITAVSSPTVAEGTDLVYAVTLSNASATPSSFAFTLGGGTAAPADYGSPSFSNGVTLVGGNLIVPAGVSAFSVTLPTVDDALDEANETVPLTIGTASGTGTITDNDPTPSLAINDVSVNEAAGTASFTVTLSAASGQTVTVDYNTSDASASAGTDYTSTTGTLSFAPGVTSRTITVPITNDTLFEGNESFNVNLLNPSNATLADALGTGTIVDDDAAPTITAVSSPTVAEGTDLVYAVTLSNASATPSSFAFTLGGGTAAPADYGSPSFSNGVTLVGGNLIVPAGVSAFSVTLPTVDDALDEANETVPLTIGTASGTGTITDNDPTPSLAINDVSVNEAAGTASFTVTLSAASGQTVTVDYNTSDASASAGTDYTSTTGTLSFAPGVTSRTITVPITNDTLFEGNESFNVNLLNPSNATLADALGTGTIVDDDAAPTITAVSSPTVAEGTDLVYAVTLSNASATPSSFAFTLGGGTAAPADYGSPSFSNGVTLVGGNLIVPAGVSAFSVTLPTVDDALDEANETVPLTIGTASGTGTITDNDPTPSLAINDVSVNEAAGTASFTVTLSAASGQTVTVDYNTSDASASAGTDYTSTTGTLSFAPGVTSRTITIPIINDLLTEPTETFNVNLTSPTNATIAVGLGIGSIIDNDARPVNAVPVAQSTAEDISRVFSTANGNAITVSDVDSTTLTTTLSVTNGILTLGSLAGVTVTGNGTGTVQLTGTAAAINTALNGTSYQPATDFSGNATLTVTTSDGNTNDVDTVAIAVTPVADAPTLYAHISTPSVATGSSVFADNFNDGNFTTPAWTRVQLLKNTFAADPSSTKGQTEAQLFNNVAWNGQTSNNEWNNSFWTVGGGVVRYNNGGGNGSDDAQGMLAYTNLSAADRARTNYAVSLDMFANPTSQQNNGGGLVFGYQNGDNYFLARWENPGTSYVPGGSQYNSYPGQSNQLSLVQMVGGVPVDLGVFNNFSTATAFNLRVEVSNFGIQVFVDDPGPIYNGVTPLISYTYGSVAGAAATPPALNTIGLYTFDNDAGVTFDNVLIDALTYRYALNLQATLNDTDGSESLSAITLASLPAGVTLTGTSGAIPISGGSASVPITSGVETTVTLTSSTPLTSAQITAIQSSVTATDTGGVTATTTVGVAQELLGTSGSEPLNGTASSDWISGGAGNDTLSGGSGNDVLLGGAGSDSLTGGSGADVFRWALADRGPVGSPPTDTISDFANGAGGDVLDLRDLLVGENANNLASYLHFVTSGGNTTLSVSSTGGFSGGFSSGAVDQVIQISGVNLVGAFANDTQVIADLLNRGKLVVDGA